MCEGTTHPRMTTAPTLILGAMTSAVTTAELSALWMFRRIPVSLLDCITSASLATCQTQGANVLGYTLNHWAALMMVLRDKVLVAPGLASTSTSATTVLAPLR